MREKESATHMETIDVIYYAIYYAILDETYVDICRVI